MSAVAIEASGLTKYYGSHRGVVDLDLVVQPGEIFGYLGPNGAGKTTTIRLAFGFIHPTRGSIRVLGERSDQAGGAIRRRVGYLPGDLRLYGSLSGNELVEFFGALRGRVDRSHAEELAARLDCDLSREIRTLSSGNRQKIGLVQAFMSDPELLILDEPTNGLDPLVQQAVYVLLREARAAGRTVFLSSHVLPEVERICDRVGILRDGRLVAVERITDLRARALRKVEVEFAGPPPADELARVEGVRDLVIDGPTLRCTVAGSMDPILKVVAAHPVHTLTSVEPSLEETFLAYYGEGRDAA